MPPSPPPFEHVYEENVFRVYGFVAYRTSSREDAEDLTQQVFERALRAWPRFDPRRASPSTWVIAIARNLLIDHYRAHRETTDVDAVPAARLPVAAGPDDDLGLSPELAAALAALSDRDREVVALRYGGDLTGPEIAELLGLSLANVQQILSRSLRRLRAALGGSEGERSGAE